MKHKFTASVAILCVISMAIVALISTTDVSAYEPDSSIHWINCPRFDRALSEAPDSAFKKPDVSVVQSLSTALKSNFGWLLGMWNAPSKLPISFAATSGGTALKTLVVDGKEVSVDEMIMTTLSSDYSNAHEQNHLRDQDLSAAFRWIDRLVVPFSQTLATKLKIKAFNAILENKKENVRSIVELSAHWTSAFSPNDDQDKNMFGAIQCAKVRVPLRWDDPENEQGIVFHVKRYLVPDASKRKGILWLIQGGPGADGSVFNRLAESFMKAFDNSYDLYVEDHRGVGRSSILEGKTVHNREMCYAEVKEVWGVSGLHGFTASGAARDILHVSKLIKAENGGLVALYGASYGSYLSNRILTIDKGEIVDLAIVDGLARPGFNFFFWDEGQDRTGKLLLAKCIESSFCREKLGVSSLSELENKMMDAYAKQANSENLCGLNTALPKLGLMRMLSLFLQTGISRDFIVPLIYRALRCNDADKIALDNFAFTFGKTIRELNYPVENIDDDAFVNKKMNILDHEMRKAVEFELSKTFVTLRPPIDWDPSNEASYSMSYELMFNIKASELSNAPNWPERSSLVDLFNKEGRLFGVGAGVSEYDSYIPRIKPPGAEDKPETYNDPLIYKWGTGYRRPLLMMTGDLDPQTTLHDAYYWQEEFKNSSLYPNHYFTVFNGTHHIQSLNALTSDRKSSCGLTVMASFLANDGHTVDLSCMTDHMDNVYPFEKTSSLELVSLFSVDFWDGTPLNFRHIANLIIGAIIVASVCLALCCICCCTICVTITVCCACTIFRRKDTGAYGQLQDGAFNRTTPAPYYHQNY